MRNKRVKRYKKNFKILKIITLLVIFICTLFISNINTTIAESSIANNDFNILKLTWARTPENFITKAKWKNGVMQTSSTDKPGVLITSNLLKSSNKTVLDYNTLLGQKGLINPTETTRVWDGKSGNRYFNTYGSRITDPANYSNYATWENKDGSGTDSWRAFRGTFNYKKTASQEVYIGVRNKNDQLIMPVNDHIIILVDGKVTKMNFSTEIKCESSNIYINNNGVSEKVNFRFACYDKSRNWGYPAKFECDNPEHNNASIHTDTWHAHLDDTRDGNTLRLGSIKDYLNDGNSHKIEVICGDYSEGGGMSELQVYTTEEPDYSLSKSGYMLDKKGNEINLIDNDGNSNIYRGDTVYYRFTMTNNKEKNSNNASITFQDEDLGVKISKDGVFVDNDNDKIFQADEEVNDYSNLSIKVNNEVKSGKSALNALNVLPANGKIEVKFIDCLKHVIDETDIKNGSFKNKVKSSLSYLNGGLTLDKDSTFTVIPKAEVFDIGVDKSISKYIRNGREVNEFDEDTLFIPGDEVFFNIAITNNSEREVTGLKLKDILSDKNGNVIKDKDWIFILPQNFDKDSFSIEGSKTLNVVTSYIVKEPQPNEEAYKLNNMVEVSKGEDESEKDTAQLEIERPSLYLMKVIDYNYKPEKDLQKTFTINLSNDNKFTYNFEGIVGTEYTIKNLFYGVNYKISELTPMNYGDYTIGLECDENNKSKVILLNNGKKYRIIDRNIVITEDASVKNRVSNKSLLNIINKRINEKYFYDSDVNTNSISLGGGLK